MKNNNATKAQSEKASYTYLGEIRNSQLDFLSVFAPPTIR